MTTIAPGRVALEFLGEALAQITLANGYRSDAGTRVHWGRRTVGGDLPCIHVNPSEAAVAEHKSNGAAKRWEREVVIELIDNGPTVPPDPFAGEDHVDDLDTAISEWIREHWPGLSMMALRFVSAETRPRDDGGDSIGAVLTVALIYQSRGTRAKGI